MKKIISSLHGFKPLVYTNGRILLSQVNRIYLSDLNFSSIEYVCTLGELSLHHKILTHSRLAQRILRLEAGPVIRLDDSNRFLIFFKGRAFNVDISTKSALIERLPAGSKKPLQLTKVLSGKHRNSVLFGDYWPNFRYEPVNIYRRLPNGLWETVYTFPKGEINHIHAIIEEPAQQVFYILTGDFDQGACIWVADNQFGDVRPLLRNGQESRACWLWPAGRQLIFATDQQSDTNYLCSVDSSEPKNLIKHFPIPGSSIYSAATLSGRLVFSTAVEPVSTNKFSFRSLLSRTRAPGMLSDKSCVYVGSLETGFQIVFSATKDYWPYALFQFGNIQFPSGSSPDSNIIHFYCTALQGHDGVAYAMALDPQA